MTGIGLYVKYRQGEGRIGPVFDVSKEDPFLVDVPCVACGHPLAAGDGRIALLAVGPGGDPMKQEDHRNHRWYEAEAIPLHAACLGVS